MKKRILTLAIVVLFALTLVPVLGGTAATVSSDLIKVALPALSPDSGANNSDTQMGWATEGFEDEDTEMDVEASIASRAVYLALEMPEMPGFIQFILQTPAGWWQQSEYASADDIEPFWDGSVLRLPFVGDWDKDDLRCKFLIGFYDDGVMDLGITDQWLEVFAEVEEGDLVEIRIPGPGFEANNNDENQMGWASNGFEHEATPMDFAGWLAARATHLVLELPEAPGYLQFILQTPAGWWQQTDMDGGALADMWDEDTNRLHVPFVGDWDGTDVRCKIQLGFYDGWDNLGITGAWLLIGPEVDLAPPEAPRELPPVGTLPLEIGVGHAMWGDEFTQLGWNGDTRAIDNKAPFDGGGLTAGLFAQAKFFVIYVDNAPDDELAEMIKLGVFGNANGWGWSEGALEAPTIQLYDADLGAIVFPIGGHPYSEAVRAAGEDEFDNRNFAIYFEYEGGVENLGITSVVLYEELPTAGSPPSGGDDTTPPPAVDPTPAPAAPADSSFPWLWVIIGGAAVVVIVVVIVIINKKK